MMVVDQELIDHGNARAVGKVLPAQARARTRLRLSSGFYKAK